MRARSSPEHRLWHPHQHQRTTIGSVALSASDSSVAPLSSRSPWASGDSGEDPAASLTRLKFASGGDGSEISVANLRTPIHFTIPLPRRSPEGTEPKCTFWDASRGVFSSEGVATLPNSAPHKHVVQWAGLPADVAALAASASRPPAAVETPESCRAQPDRQLAALLNSSAAAAGTSPRLLQATAWDLAGRCLCGCKVSGAQARRADRLR